MTHDAALAAITAERDRHRAALAAIAETEDCPLCGGAGALLVRSAPQHDSAIVCRNCIRGRSYVLTRRQAADLATEALAGGGNR